MGSPLNPNARKVGKRSKDDGKGKDSGKDSGKGDRESSQPTSYIASCPQCGNLGAYLDSRDATNAENLHQYRVHGNSAHKRTISDTAQNKRNKGGGW